MGLIKIYKIVNTINDDFYVGSTKNELRKRLFQHKSYGFRFPNRNNLYILANEYGWENFRIIELDEGECASKSEQLKFEQKYIDELKPQLNKVNASGYTCKHNKERHTCKECKGNGICIHNKIKYACKKCDGTSSQKMYCYNCENYIRKGHLKRHFDTPKHWKNTLPVGLII
jgi:group I intron endonuclease